MFGRRSLCWCTWFFIMGICGIFWRCEHQLNVLSSIRVPFAVSYNPYEQVDWVTWKRCLSQHHDHVAVQEAKIRDYDRAGYDAICLLNYSGRKSTTFAEVERLWPLSKFRTEYEDDQTFLITADHLKFFIPSMEEIGTDEHVTSPFLTTWIARWEPSQFERRSNWHYDSQQQCMDVIRRFGGLPIIAHPTANTEFYLSLHDVQAIEIYNASFRFHFLEGKFSEDKNHRFRVLWDDLLTHRSSRIFGYAVNDWYGPFNKEVALSHPDVFDSGKTLVLIPEYSLQHYRNSLLKGAFFAIQDNGQEKGQYPKIAKIDVQPGSIEIRTDRATVNWFFAGVRIHTGSVLDLSHLSSNMNYVRAEVSNAHATTYVQPFSLQPVPSAPN